MKFKVLTLVMSLIIEILACIFFILEKIDPVIFSILVMSHSVIIGLYFWDRNEIKRKGLT